MITRVDDAGQLASEHAVALFDVVTRARATAFVELRGFTKRLREDADLNRDDDPVLFDLVRYVDTLCERVAAAEAEQWSRQ